VVQVMFVVLAIVFLFAVMTSSQLKARVKVFLGKHFYKNKYDYRVEWLNLTESLNERSSKQGSYQQSIQSMASIVEAKAGMLWMKGETGTFINMDSWHCRHIEDHMETKSSLISFLEQKAYVINLHELDSHAHEYAGLDPPAWLATLDDAWLIVPLFSAGELVGFIVLASPLVQRQINWEDRDLLKAAAKQVASHLVVLQTSAQLAEAKQFEVFSRLSAFMVHDLKNIAAELELVSRNAKKHMANPEFLEDAFDTVENASRDINRLLEQLRNKRMEDEKKVRVDLLPLVEEVVASRQHQLPAPLLVKEVAHAYAVLQRDRLKNVIIHLVENAQQATDDSGEIVVTLSGDDHMCRIEIRDTGHGMDEAFVRDRLFKPFDTTKGNAGMGIGMFESREFIRQLGGDIQIRSETGKGTVITLNIPSEQSISE
jgi:putative PEP-CTERM system histidine kinase